MEEREPFPENFGSEYFGSENFGCELGASFRLRIPFMANASRPGGVHYVGRSVGVPKFAELIDLLWGWRAERHFLDQPANVALPDRW